ncbi:hypothetical protein EH220_02980 [bacterium]|nr:MAG: hypothetical protein EH220_02980 [bacterium]
MQKGTLARLVGIGIVRLDQLRQSWGHPYETGRGNKLRIYAPHWIRRWHETHMRLASASNKASASDPVSRRNEATAMKAEIEVKRLQKELIPVDDVIEDFRVVAGKIREGIEVVGRLNSEARDVMIAQLREAEDIFKRQHGHYKSNGDNKRGKG